MKKRNMERMRYINDTLSSSLCLLSIAGNIMFFITIYASATVVPDLLIGVDVVLNIVFMLLAFLASEEAKVYKLEWAYGILGLALVQFARIFWLPERYHGLEQLVGNAYLLARVSMLGSAVLMLVAGITCYINSAALRKYLKEQGA